MDFTEQSATEAVVTSFVGAEDARTSRLLGLLVAHLHDFVREARPTVDEWQHAIDFLTRTGQTCDATRQEFILLSDVLGISMLVETINGQEVGTESTVEGPFHVAASPPLDNGASIDLLGGRVPCVVRGRVLDPGGRALAGAAVDVWQCSEDGFYDVQQPDVQPAGNGRGLFTTDESGGYWFRTVVPSFYPIPQDGPVGELLRATARHPFRPAHVHFVVEAPGHRRLTTHMFVADSPYLDSDAVFAVKSSLITPFLLVEDVEQAAALHLDAPFRLAEIDLVLDPREQLVEMLHLYGTADAGGVRRRCLHQARRGAGRAPPLTRAGAVQPRAEHPGRAHRRHAG